MDLLSNLSSTKWQNSEPNTINDLKSFVVVRSKMLKQGIFEYYIREDTEDAGTVVATLDGCAGKCNPLQSVRNVEMKVDNGKIIAINLDGDCVIKK